MCHFRSRSNSPSPAPHVLHLLPLLLLAQFVHPQPTYLIAPVVHRCSSAPLRRSSLSSSAPLRPSSSITSSMTSHRLSTSSTFFPSAPPPHPSSLSSSPSTTSMPIDMPLPMTSSTLVQSKSSSSSSFRLSSTSRSSPILDPPLQAPSSTSPTPLRTSSFLPLSSPTAATSQSSSYKNIPVVQPQDNTTETGSFASELITLNEPFGQYFVVMKLGSPAFEIVLIIDTGSEITWVQCEPCLKCGSQIRDPIFDPSKSRSYRKLRCNSNWCRDTTGLAMGCQKSTDPSLAEKYGTSPTIHTECFYNATYGDNSVSYGELAVDTLTFPSASSGISAEVSMFVFGCGHQNSGVETDFSASGLMGLDRGSHSIISQLGMQRFAYCLPDRSQSVDTAGFVVFGNYNLTSNLLSRGQKQQLSVVENADTPPPMQYVKLLLNNKSDFYAQSYYVNLSGIRVGNQLLNIPSSLFGIDAISGYGGTIIDTGTTLTSFVDLAYAVFQEGVRVQVSGDARPIYIPELPSFDMCYTVGREEVAWPEIRLQFDGGTTEILLPERNTWLHVGTEGDRNLYCLAFASAGEGAGGRNVIGNFQQQNFLVEYDIARERIGFVHLRRCSSSSAAVWPSNGPFAWLHILILAFTVFSLSFSCSISFSLGTTGPVL